MPTGSQPGVSFVHAAGIRCVCIDVDLNKPGGPASNMTISCVFLIISEDLGSYHSPPKAYAEVQNNRRFTVVGFGCFWGSSLHHCIDYFPRFADGSTSIYSILNGPFFPQ